MEPKPVPIVTLDGMPATGKTEIIEALKKHSTIRIKVISDHTDPRVLNNYYLYPEDYAIMFHTDRLRATASAMADARTASVSGKYDLVVLERSLYGCQVAFELDFHSGFIDEKHRSRYMDRFATAIYMSKHPDYYFLLSDYNLNAITQRIKTTRMNPKHFDAGYFTQYLLTQTRIFESQVPQNSIVHHLVLNVSTNCLYLNDTIKKIQSLAGLREH